MSPVRPARPIPSFAGPAVALAVFALVLGLRSARAPQARAAASAPGAPAAAPLAPATTTSTTMAAAPRASGTPSADAAQAPEIPAEVRLQGGVSSLDALGERVVDALRRKDVAALRALTVTRGEHRAVMFPGMRADQGAGADFYYDNMAAGSWKDLARALAELGGKPLELRAVRERAEEAERRGEVVIHRGIELRVREGGQERSLALVGGVVELRGAFKITRYREP